MIRFNIAGEYLELPANFSLQFQKINVLFAFDKAECERSTSFDIPATPENNRIFALAKWIASPGTGMRRRYSAQMQAGLVTKNGYLYLDGYEPGASGGQYKAIFITGELLWLKALRELGNIKDLQGLAGLKNAVRATSNAVTATNALNVLWTKVAYHETDGVHPSVGITPLLNLLGYDDRDHFTTGLNLRWIPAKLNPVQSESLDYNITIQNTSQGGYVPLAYDAVNVSEITPEGQSASEFYFNDVFFDAVRVLVKYTSGGVTYHAYVTELLTKFHTLLTFGNGTGADYFVGYFNQQTGSGQDYGDLSDFTFLGGYSFDTSGNVTGTPLAGRTVDIPAGTLVCVIRKDWYTDGLGWKIDTPTFTLSACAVTFDDYAQNPPAIYRLIDNLPDFSLVDVFKTAASMTGTALYYTEAAGVILDFMISDGERISLDGRVLQESGVRRVFSDYAQHNFIRFKEDASQYGYEIDELDYTVDNDNLTAEKTLQAIPAGNGGIFENAGTHATISIRGEQAVDVLAKYDANEPYYLCRAPLDKMQDIQDLCNASTSLTIKAKMSLLEFNNIQPKTQLYYAGVTYMWTEAQWSKDVATFKLAKNFA